MTNTAQEHRTRSWYRRPSVWLLGVVLLALAVLGVVGMMGGPATISYGTFLDQLKAHNIASVTFDGTLLDGRFRGQTTIADVNEGAPLTTFRSRMPDFGDPSLLAELRGEHVLFGAGTSQWLGVGGLAALGVLGGILLAKPMLLVIAAAFVAGLIKVARGGKMDLSRTLSKFPMFRSFPGHGGEQNPSVGDSAKSQISGPSVDQIAGTASRHAGRAWYRHPLVWTLSILFFMAIAVFGVLEMSGGPAAIPYSAFLDQLDAGNVASVAFRGTRIDGRFRKHLAEVGTKGASQQTTFRSSIPDFGDPTLLPELRGKHVAIDVEASTSWLAWLGRLPWPLVLVLVAILIAGLIRLARGKSSKSGSATPMHPMQERLARVSRFFAKETTAGGASKDHEQEAKSGRNGP